MRANRPGPGRPSPGLRPDPAGGVPPAPRGRGFESPNPAKMKRPWEGIATTRTRRRRPEPSLPGLGHATLRMVDERGGRDNLHRPLSRQGDVKLSPLTHTRLDPDTTSLLLDEHLHEVQTQACSGLVPMLGQAPERGEDLRQVS